MYRDVLLATDGSPASRPAVDHALDLADHADARLHALFVAEPGRTGRAAADGRGDIDETDGTDERDDPAETDEADGTAVAGGTTGAGRTDWHTEEGRRAVETVADRAATAGVDCTTAIREGAPHEEIRAYAADEGVDLVVMGTHGRTGLDRHLLGSVSERVVRTAPVPVLTVGPDAGSGDDRAVKTAEGAVERAREALERRGHDDVSIPTGPSPQRSAWVVRAVADGGTFNVHVDRASGDPHVVRID